MSKKDRKKVSKDAVKKNARESAKSGANYINLPDGIDYYSPEPGGKVKMDILPYEVTSKKHPDGISVGDLWYKLPFKIHRDVGGDNKIVICPKSIKKPCPICEHRISVLEDVDGDEAIAKALKPKDRVLYAVVPRTGKGKGDLHVWEFSYYLFQELLDKELLDEDNEEHLTFSDPEDGRTLKIRFAEETFQKNKFAKADQIVFLEREPIDDDVLDEVPDLAECLVVLSYDQIKNLFLELDDEDEGDDVDGDEKPRKPKEKAEKKEEPEDDDEEDEHARAALAKKQIEEKEDEDEKEPVVGATVSFKTKDGEVLTGDITKIKGKKITVTDVEDDDYTIPRSNIITIELPKEKPAKEKKEKSEKSSGKDKCPHGHKFGKNVDKEAECDNCDVWDACFNSSS